ncbi:MAG: hypothetical protein M3O28_06055 [Actinomycetota bacterium]|nr:hypothetical protein [Actinomycetota bacterium]MDP9167638.1 hypothetical protein [Actinomycetota bacterium]
MPDQPTDKPYFDPPPPYRRRPMAQLRTARRVGRRRRYRRFSLIVAVLAALTAAAVILSVAFGGRSQPAAKTPAEAVARLLDAARSSDIGAAKAALCREDQRLGALSHLQGLGVIESYTIGAVGTQQGFTVVNASFITSRTSVAQPQVFPVVDQGGSWRVCFSLAINSALSAHPTSGAPTLPGLFVTPVATPTAPSGLVGNGGPQCTGQASGYDVALNYIGSAEIGSSAAAQSCVYRGLVAPAVTAGLAGQLYGPVTQDGAATVIVFHSSATGATVTVTTAREHDARFYVTSVSVR